METKRKYFIDVVPIMPCHNSPWIMGSRIYGEKNVHIPLSSRTTIDPLAQDPGQIDPLAQDPGQIDPLAQYPGQIDPLAQDPGQIDAILI